MPIFPQFLSVRNYKSLSIIQLRQCLKSTESHLYDLAGRISRINTTEYRTLGKRVHRQFLIYQVGYYFALYEYLYDIWMEKEKLKLIADSPGMKVLFDKGIVKDIQDVIALREKAKKKPANPP